MRRSVHPLPSAVADAHEAHTSGTICPEFVGGGIVRHRLKECEKEQGDSTINTTLTAILYISWEDPCYATASQAYVILLRSTMSTIAPYTVRICTMLETIPLKCVESSTLSQKSGKYIVEQAGVGLGTQQLGRQE